MECMHTGLEHCMQDGGYDSVAGDGRRGGGRKYAPGHRTVHRNLAPARCASRCSHLMGLYLVMLRSWQFSLCSKPNSCTVAPHTVHRNLAPARCASRCSHRMGLYLVMLRSWQFSLCRKPNNCTVAPCTVHRNLAPVRCTSR